MPPPMISARMAVSDREYLVEHTRRCPPVRCQRFCSERDCANHKHRQLETIIPFCKGAVPFEPERARSAAIPSSRPPADRFKGFWQD